MLVLTRKEDEAIILTMLNGSQIDIIVTRIKGRQVSIGIDANDDVERMREELLSNSDN